MTLNILVSKLQMASRFQETQRTYMDPILEISHSLEVNGDLYATKITPIWLLYTFFYKNKLCKNNKAETDKKTNKNKLRAFSGYDVQKWKIILTMIYISFKNLLTKEWPGHLQSKSSLTM